MISIIYTHWAMNKARSELMRLSMLSLIESGVTEILVADNGGSIEDSQFFLKLVEEKKIAVYVRFRENMSYAYARNILLDICTQDFIAIVDNDIIVEKGWWEECVEFLVKHPDRKLIATPLVPDLAHRIRKFWDGECGGWQLNTRAGSPCFVMTRKTFEDIGKFEKHNMAGSKYADALVRKGYRVAIMPQCKAADWGERRGYDWRNANYSKKL